MVKREIEQEEKENDREKTEEKAGTATPPRQNVLWRRKVRTYTLMNSSPFLSELNPCERTSKVTRAGRAQCGTFLIRQNKSFPINSWAGLVKSAKSCVRMLVHAKRSHPCIVCSISWTGGKSRRRTRRAPVPRDKRGSSFRHVSSHVTFS